MPRCPPITVEESLGATCLDCGYALRGLRSRRCPECGRAFDPADPLTIRLPNWQARLAAWLAQPGAGRKWLPLLAIIGFAWGTRVPGWEHGALWIGGIVFAVSLAVTVPWWVTIWYVRRCGYDDERIRDVFRRWVRNLGLAAIVIALLVTLRPMMYVCFWVSRPWLDSLARDVLAQPFQQSPPSVRAVRGLYFVGNTRRCPHGVKVVVISGSRDRDGEPGFLYLADGGELPARFRTGLPLGGGWYASD